MSIIVLSVYLISTMGFGKYSCHCDHASKISVLGVSSKCSCTDEEHKKDPNHHCPACGRHLVSKMITKSDCCSLKYFLLHTDQDFNVNSYSFDVYDMQFAEPSEFIKVFVQSAIKPRIKTFQALFHRVTESLFEKYLQLIL